MLSAVVIDSVAAVVAQVLSPEGYFVQESSNRNHHGWRFVPDGLRRHSHDKCGVCPYLGWPYIIPFQCSPGYRTGCVFSRTNRGADGFKQRPDHRSSRGRSGHGHCSRPGCLRDGATRSQGGRRPDG